MATNNRRQLLNLRTTQMTEKMYQHVEKRIADMPGKTFREYAFLLIEKDMLQEKEKSIASDKNLHVYDELLNLRDEMERQFNQLNRKMDDKTLFYSEEQMPFKKPIKDIKEGHIASEEITGSIDEEFDLDF